MPQESMSGAEAMGGGGSSTLTLAQLYAAGLSGADSTLTLDATRSGLVITASALADVVPLTVNNTSTDTTGPQGVVAVTGSHTVASGSSTFRPLSVAYTINQTGSASGAITGIFVNATETAVLGAHNLLELQVGVAANNSRFAVANSGAVTVDCTATAAAIPLTLKNAKSESGIELWYTGTVRTGYGLMNASGTLKGGIAIAAATNDWLTGSAADDIVIHSGATKKIRLGAKGATAATVSIDCGALSTFSLDNGGITNNTSGGINGGMSVQSSGVLKAYVGVWSPSNVLFIGTQGTGGRVSLQMNGVERLSLAASGDVVIGAGDTAATVLVTTAAAGFLRLSTFAGTPTGAAVDGAFGIDTTGSKLWARVGGAWKSVAVA